MINSFYADEVGYVAGGDRHVNLSFDETVFGVPRVFLNAACMVSLIDRHHAEIPAIDGESYRARKARERAENPAMLRKKRKRS